MTWRRIKDDPPPKDGTTILLYGLVAWLEYHFDDGDAAKKAVTGYWEAGQGDAGEWVTNTENPYRDIVQPTHWQPIDPPAYTRPPLATLAAYLPPPKDLTRLSDAELARYCWAMGQRLQDSGLDNTCRLLDEASARLGGRNER